MKEVDAVILCTPTPMHASQALACLGGRQARAGRDPALRPARRRAGGGRGRRAPAARSRCAATRGASTRATSGCASGSSTGELNIQQMDVQTYFFRRTNMNALGQPRSWTDHLLWHHAAHTVDLFAYQTRSPIVKAQRDPGPDPPDAGHRDGHEHPARGGERRDLHAEPVVQQRRAARHLLPLHRRHRHLHRPLRRPVRTARTRRSTSPRSRCR